MVFKEAIDTFNISYGNDLPILGGGGGEDTPTFFDAIMFKGSSGIIIFKV